MASTTIDVRELAHMPHDSGLPVTTAVYTVQFVMDEDDFNALNEDHIERFAAEIQRVMDEAGFAADLRYQFCQFAVVSRVVVNTTPASNPQP